EARAARGPFAGASFGGGFGVDGARGRALVALRFEAWWPDEASTAAPGVRARYSGLGGSAEGCGLAVRGPRFHLAGCAGARVAALRGASQGALVDQSATAPWTAALAALETRVRIYRALHLDAGAELAVSASRPRFAVTNFGDVLAVPRLVPAVVLGLSLDI